MAKIQQHAIHDKSMHTLNNEAKRLQDVLKKKNVEFYT